MIRKYKNYWGVILPRGGGVKRFKTEKAAKQFMLACGLFEDVWPDEPQTAEAEEPAVAPTPEDEAPEDALEEQTEQPEEDD